MHYKDNLDQNVGGYFSNNITETDLVSETLEEDIYEGITFKIQIAASSRKIMTKPYNFKGLDPISVEELGELYKYYYGSTSDYNVAKRLKSEADLKGYDGCFIVAFKNNQQVPLTEVLKTTSN